MSTNADVAEICRAYRKEALRRHPDNHAAATADAAGPATTGDGAACDEDKGMALSNEGGGGGGGGGGSRQQHHIKGFLDLTEAYRILSNDASRDAYDKHGLCFVREEGGAMMHRRGSTEEEEEGGGSRCGHREEDYYIDLIDELFGISAVVDYVGATSSLIAPIINEMLFSIAATPGSKNIGRGVDITDDLQQRRRMVDNAFYLRERVRPYVRGEVSADKYASSCRREAHFILQVGGRSGGEESTAALLWIIGTTLLEEADPHAGGAMVPVSFVRKTLSKTTRRVRSTFSNARAIYFRAALEGLSLGGGRGGGPGGDYGSSSASSEDDDADDCSGVGGRNKKSNKEHVDQDAVLDLLWQYVVNDSVATL